MKTRLLVALLPLLLATPLLADDQPARPDVDELLEVSHAQENHEAMIQRNSASLEKSLRHQLAGSQDEAQSAALLDKVTKMEQEELGWEKLKPVYEKAYADVYTTDEVKGIVAFYKSPTGQAFVTKTPAMMQELAELRRSWLAGGSGAQPSPTVSGTGDTTRPDVAELLETARVKESFETMKNRMKEITGKMSQQPGADTVTKTTNERMNAAISKLDWDQVKAEYAKVYADTFTPDQTRDMIQFYKSPAGQAYLDKKPLLEQKVATIVPGLVATILPKIREMFSNATASPSPSATSGT